VTPFVHRNENGDCKDKRQYIGKNSAHQSLSPERFIRVRPQSGHPAKKYCATKAILHNPIGIIGLQKKSGCLTQHTG
jgi:hypothetical protein